MYSLQHKIIDTNNNTTPDNKPQHRPAHIPSAYISDKNYKQQSDKIVKKTNKFQFNN